MQGIGYKIGGSSTWTRAFDSIFYLSLVASLAAMSMVTFANSSGQITVGCSAAGAVPPPTIAALCDGLLAELTAKYPNASFIQADAKRPQGSAAVTLEAFRATSSGLEARLIFQAQGQPAVKGPRLGLSVTDTDLTPDMQQKFLNHLVNDTALPL